MPLASCESCREIARINNDRTIRQAFFVCRNENDKRTRFFMSTVEGATKHKMCVSQRFYGTLSVGNLCSLFNATRKLKRQ